MSKFTYFRIDTQSIKDERFVRISNESVDQEFKQMRHDEHRTFPFFVFDLGDRNESDNYVQVLCSRLRSVSASKTDALDQVWK
jgi:hypothetical protein